MFRSVTKAFSSSVKSAYFSTVNKKALKNVDKVCFFSSKRYDIEGFNKINNKADSANKLSFNFHPEELNNRTAALVPDDIGTVCAFVNDKLDESTLNALNEKGVKLIALRCAGFNNVDLKVADELGLKVVRVPAYSPYAVAEHAMALLLTLNRRIHKAYNRTKEGNFALDGLLGFDIHGKTIGIIGGGKIGQCFASICKGFGVELLYHDVQKVPEMEAFGAKKTDLEILFQESDVVSLHCPLTPETKYIVSQESLELMKPHAIIINTGRGGLLETKACVSALKHRRLGGLAIDVYEQEESLFFEDRSDEILTHDDLARLLTFPNVIVTGHQAFFTAEALSAICSTTINNILEFKNTGACENEVTLPK